MSEEPKVWACTTCASCRVQSQMWVTANTSHVLDDTGRYHWCDACEEDGDDGEQKYLTEIPLSETRESKRLAQLEAHGTDQAEAREEADELRAVLAELEPKTAEAPKPPRVIVEVRGGVVQAVYGDRPLNFDILDHDDWSDANVDDETAQECQKLSDEINRICWPFTSV